MIREVGIVTKEICDLLEISPPEDDRVYLGDTNIIHMKSRHPEAFEKYGEKIVEILAYPDYVRKNPKDGSIEYVREYFENNEFVKLAVRLSNTNKFYARSLYILNDSRVDRYVKDGRLLRVNS